jgi:hypothetical protein
VATALESSARALRRLQTALVYLVAGTILCSFGLSALAYAVPTVSVEPPSIAVHPSEEFELQLWISAEADTISNYDVVFQFDPLIVQFVEAIEGSLYVNSGFSTWFAAEEESFGTWEVFDALLQAGSFVLAPGELVRLKFAALAPGISPVQLQSVVVTDIDRYPLDPLVWENGTVIVDQTDDVQSPDIEQTAWTLGAPHPNPSTAGTNVVLSRAAGFAPSRPQLAVHDTNGRLIKRLDPTVVGSRCEFFWDGTDCQERSAPSGIYFLSLKTPVRTLARKVFLVR